ncbi:MAG TPA: GxxExxY protein [Gemmatimonadaceae bacterium]|jgi:GxxExxY protein
MPTIQLVEEKLTRSVIGAFYDVYNELGFGHFEHVYKAALERELLARGHQVGREVAVMVMYKGEALAMERLDMIVDGKVVVEVKSTAELHPSAMRQTYSYLRATHLQVGLVLHFGLEPKFHRVVELRKRATTTKHITDRTDSADPTDQSLTVGPTAATNAEG